MTECSPAIAGRGVTCRTYGTVGPPVSWTELRVVSDVGKALPAGEEGTIEVRGAQVTKGYYRDEEENRKSFTSDGFFKTGDLGKMTINGELMITGRAKEIIVLSSGENIDPTKIENALTMFPFIQEALLVGHDKKALGALLVPNIEELKEYVAKKMSGLKKETGELLTDVKVLDQIRNDMNRILRPKLGFKPHEKLQGIIFLDKEFKLGEELTNTLKKKRHVIEKKYRKIINDLLHCCFSFSIGRMLNIDYRIGNHLHAAPRAFISSNFRQLRFLSIRGKMIHPGYYASNGFLCAGSIC